MVLLFVWTTEPSRAIITGERCVALGRAVAKLCADSPKRIAMYASGGLSHPFNRPGWVDEGPGPVVLGSAGRRGRGGPQVHVQLPGRQHRWAPGGPLLITVAADDYIETRS